MDLGNVRATVIENVQQIGLDQLAVLMVYSVLADLAYALRLGLIHAY